MAFKILPGYVVRDEGVLAQFDREMKVVAELDHPGIFRETDTCKANVVYDVAIERIDGLYVNRRGPMPITNSCSLVCQAAFALRYAQGSDVLNCDSCHGARASDPALKTAKANL
ncbi:MAG: hypothetical protein ABI557_10345 [Aureliella sp.]